MRPLRLELKGFTAFRDPAVIDFTELDVFAISGPTGSGKSSLLDAMTYALYGRVERVGDQVGQLISQGQPRMAVTLEFEVGRQRYRVTRTTKARGATKILVQRQGPDGDWVQAGEGADKVTQAKAIIAGAIGLSYDGFTRSVLLPQGKFAEFLVGDPRKRRDILTELLGLSLFRRMAERAGTIGKECSVRAQERNLAVEREYGDVTPAAVKEAKRAATDARKRERELAAAAEHVLEALGRWRETTRAVEELRACAHEAARAADRARVGAKELATLAESLERAEAERVRRTALAEAAERGLREARSALKEQEARGPSTKELAGARLRAHTLMEAVATRRAKEAQLTSVAEEASVLEQGLTAAEAALAQRTDALAGLEAVREEAERALEAARHTDLVAAISAGRKAGDPCPVCGLPLKETPKRGASGALDRATKALEKSRRAVEAGGEERSRAERAVDGARRAIEANEAERERVAREVDELGAKIDELGAALHVLLGEPMAEDPVAAVEERLAGRDQLDRAERAAGRQATEAQHALLLARQERDRVAQAIARQGDRLALGHGAVLERVARAVGEDAASLVPPSPPDGADPGSLLDHAARAAGALDDLAHRLDGEAARQSVGRDALFESAAARVGGLVGPVDSLEGLAEAVNEACRAATAEVAATAERAGSMAERLGRKKQLAEEAGQLEDRSRLFKALALELRADRLVAFLQAEALQLLATAGSDRLGALSGGRYRLVCRDDEFLAVDTWNGDEERSVRTLSGGETFLASLALALALADQVRSLSVTDRARLDSLFLDEGFGTLDEETLRVVVDAIERLAGDGRLVGVITHVSDLADQFPRIEVDKSPRGSRLRLVRT